MIIYDPLYGSVRLPSRLIQLVSTPEVRRLSQIRLLNTLTPSIPTLGEIRRYSHTLGVLALAQDCRLEAYTGPERDSFAAAVLLHDIGTPPFAHLFEYHLKERFSAWNHESMIHDVLWGTHAPENTAHQFFGKQTLAFRRRLESLRFDLPQVADIVCGNHPLSVLLFGSLDLDNIDNVCRMAWAIGIDFDHGLPRRLANDLSACRAARTLELSLERRGDVSDWQVLRRQVYSVLLRDGPTVAAQAVLSSAIEVLLDRGTLTAEDWCLTDESLIDRLLACDETKETIGREFLGMLPFMTYSLRLCSESIPPGLRSRGGLKEIIEDSMARAFPNDKCLGYVFFERGSLEKRLEFVDTVDGCRWQSGRTSESTILYGFVRNRPAVSAKRCREAAELLLGAIPGSKLADTDSYISGHPNDAQRTFDFAGQDD